MRLKSSMPRMSRSSSTTIRAPRRLFKAAGKLQRWVLQPADADGHVPGAERDGYAAGSFGMVGFRQGMPFRPKFPVDKNRSICKACQGVGHWAGDATCPMNGFANSSAAGNIPALLGPNPLGTGLEGNHVKNC